MMVLLALLLALILTLTSVVLLGNWYIKQQEALSEQRMKARRAQFEREQAVANFRMYLEHKQVLQSHGDFGAEYHRTLARLDLARTELDRLGIDPAGVLKSKNSGVVG